MIGEKLGPYTIESELGSGGMGKVYLARNSGVVALKVLHPHLLESAGSLERFEREAEIGRRVEHANVVRTLDVGSAVVAGVTHHFLVMEYVEGQTLRGLVGELGRVPEELCRHIGRQIVQGLAAIHAAGVVHRDLKPENVLITDAHVVKVMDLGVAKLLDEAIKLSQTGAFLGSVLYAAPEQFMGTAPDRRADYYSLGLVLYELATGRHPFAADAFADVLKRQLDEKPRPAAEINPQLSPFFEEVCQALLEKDREVRLSFLPEDEESAWWRERARAIRRETRRPLRRIRIPRETAVYGRSAELAKLRAVYDQVVGGEGRVLLLEGEAGIGKTRLVDEFVGQLRQAGEDLNFLFGSYPPGGAATAAGAFTTAYGEQFGETGAADYLMQTPALVPSFAALLNGEPTPRGEEPLTKESLQSCFVHATRGLAAERPTLVLIDDLHFAPDEGRALFTALALAAPGHRILLVGTMRPGVAEEWIAGTTRLTQCEQLSLARLGPKDLIRLLQDSFGSEQLAENLGVKIALKSDGNPFFAFEIIDGLRQGQFIAKNADGSWGTTRVIDEIEIPSSVMDLIQARIAALDEQERDLLDVASCCGFEFDPGLVGAALGLGPIPALKQFGQIERRHRLIRSAGRHYVFDHHQVQEAIYASLHDQLREPYHAALGEALESRTAEPEGAVAVALAEHYLKGACGERARPYLEPALDYLKGSYLNDAALRLADRALQAAGVVEGEARALILLRKATFHMMRAERALERAALDEALKLADESGVAALRSRVRDSLSSHLHVGGDPDAAQPIAEEALSLALEAGDRGLEATALGSLGTLAMVRGQHEQARSQLGEALRLAREIGDRSSEAEALVHLGGACLFSGAFEEGCERLQQAAALAQAVGAPKIEAAAAANLAYVLPELDRAEEARAYLERSLALYQQTGHRPGQVIGSSGLADSDQMTGRLAEALSSFESSLAMAREIGDGRGEDYALRGMASVAWSLGRTDEARALCERLALPARGTRNAQTADSLSSLATLHEREGQLDEARRLNLECAELWRERGDSDQLAEALIKLARIDGARGDSMRATEVLDEALALKTRRVRPRLCATVARAGLPGGDPQAAVAMLEEHEKRVGHADRMELRFRVWELTQDKTHLEEAHRLLCFLRDHAPEQDRDSMIENVPLHRDIMRAWEERRGAGA